MSSCVNMNSKEFQDLVQQTGLNPLILKSRVGVWSEYTGLDRMPTFEEISQYQEDKEAVQKAFAGLIKEGVYPANLWG